MLSQNITENTNGNLHATHTQNHRRLYSWALLALCLRANHLLPVHNLGADALVCENLQQQAVRQTPIDEMHTLHTFL